MWSQTVLQVGLGVALMAGAISVATAADMVLIPKGEFTMGSNEHSDEAKHQVVLDAYLIDKFEASNVRYKEFMKATGHPAPAYWDDPRLNKATLPVVGVSWTDASAFCQWDGKRLPTEAEWSVRPRVRKATTIIHGAIHSTRRKPTMARTLAVRPPSIPIPKA